MVLIFGRPIVFLLFCSLQLTWEAPDVDGLVEFLVRDKGFKCVLIFLPRFRWDARFAHVL